MHNSSIGILSIARFINDIYGNFIPQLLPFLIAGGIVTVTTGATLVGAFTITSSIAQPIFGYLVDQRGSRLVDICRYALDERFIGYDGICP